MGHPPPPAARPPAALPRPEAEQRERIPTRVAATADDACRALAAEIAALLRERAAQGRTAVLGLATGSTPVRLYRELIRLHREEGLSFAHVVTFNLDEYHGLPRDHPESYWRFMHEQLFDHVDIPPGQIHVPDGTTPRTDAYAACRAYEEAIAAASGIDLQILGIGRTGHIGFNEPGSGRDSRTRLVTLDRLTRRDAARDFLGEARVPRHALTMGVGTILEARRIVLLAWGGAKAPVIARAVEEPPTEALPASFLQSHPDARVLVDEPAAAALTRRRHPWLVGAVPWTARLVRTAVAWLATTTGKPILKLTDADYAEHGLADLLTAQGPAYDLNIRNFNELQHTITGWPGGKPGADDTHRPERAAPHPKRIVVLAPEPSDDVLGMGGTVHRLVDQGHEVTIAFLTSGNLAVPDAEAAIAADLILDLARSSGPEGAAEARYSASIRRMIEEKGEFDADPRALRGLKGMVRRGEARAALEACGVARERIRFLDLPFYEAGRYRRFRPGPEDTAAVAALLDELRPHLIFTTGARADPSSVEAVAYAVVQDALRITARTPWRTHCRTWLFRPPPREWDPAEVDMAVPLSPDELARKIAAASQHRSQRTQAPGTEAGHHETWQAAEETNRRLAQAYDALGLPEYEALEAFARSE